MLVSSKQSFLVVVVEVDLVTVAFFLRNKVVVVCMVDRVAWWIVDSGHWFDALCRISGVDWRVLELRHFVLISNFLSDFRQLSTFGDAALLTLAGPHRDNLVRAIW